MAVSAGRTAMLALAVAAGITIDQILTIGYDGGIVTIVYIAPGAVTPTKCSPTTTYLDVRT
jgi:hypothetical protein